MDVNHPVGLAAHDVSVQLYHYDCVTPVAVNEAVSIIEAQTELSSNAADYSIEFNKNTLSNGDSSLVVVDEQTGDNKIQFCTMLELLRSEDNMSMTFKKSKFSLTLDMSAGFFVVSVNTNGQDIEVVQEDISMFDISACQCQESFDCDDTSVVVEQGSSIGICLMPSSTGVEITNFDLSLAANGYTYTPITMNGDDQIIDSTTSISTNNEVTKITTRLVTNLFQGLSDVVVISGSGILEFEQNKKRNEPTSSTKEFYAYISTYEAPCCRSNKWTSSLRDLIDSVLQK
jgi:hypothetical protein